MNIVTFDHFVFHLVNGNVGNSKLFDAAVFFLADKDVLKGIPVMMVWWGLWFYKSPKTKQNRENLLAMLAVSVIAIFAGRLLALNLPFRLRPIHDASIGTKLVEFLSPQFADGMSSFPSDHAVLFFVFATCLFQINKVIGLIFYLHAVVIISLTRIYLGLHFPGDVLVGALVGCIVAMALLRPIAKFIEKYNLLTFEDRFGYIFYPIIFFLTLQSATMFDSARAFLRELARLI